MNLKSIYKAQVQKVQDMKKEDQTDKVKVELYNLVQQFVRKYWRRYYPSYKGDLHELVADFYEQFLTPKSREKGKEQSLLDKFDENVTTLPYLVKVAVQRMLIDRSRSDKNELNYAEKYDEETGDLTLDFLAKHLDDDTIQVEDIEFTESEVLELRDLYDEMDPDAKRRFLKNYEDTKDILSPNFQKLFKDLVGGDTYLDYLRKTKKQTK